MPRLIFGPQLAPGPRTVVAMTCSQCHRLQPGDRFGRTRRLPGGPLYVDRRCLSCRWARMEASPGR